MKHAYFNNEDNPGIGRIVIMIPAWDNHSIVV